MIYYPLSVLMMAGIHDVLIISTESDIPQIATLLGDGSSLGIHISYKVQHQPRGIPDAFLLGEDFLKGESCLLILGDNFFYGHIDFLKNAVKNMSSSCIFALPVQNPQQYGVVEFKPHTFEILSIEEKPQRPKSQYAIPGLYLFDNRVVDLTKKLTQSKRGELEITDLISLYWRMNQMQLIPLSRGLAWLDMGTPAALLEASLFVKMIEERQGLKIACLEEIAYRLNLISKEQLDLIIQSMPTCSYKYYLETLFSDL
jgi:glucose-1-phosphate thymidylyltransferase